MKVTYEDHMGSDLAVVNAARVSFKKKSDWQYNVVEHKGYDNEWYEINENPHLKDSDKSLIKYLARGVTSKDWDALIKEVAECNCPESVVEILNHIRTLPRHWSPFANGGTIKLHIKAPIFVARQLFKHQAGFNPPNEVSRRYVTEEPEFYVPEVWRKAAKDKKQGSLDEKATFDSWFVNDLEIFSPDILMDVCVNYYNMLIEDGVCAEQARMVLPQSMYTEWVWTGNLYAWATLYNTRTKPDVQRETKEVAYQIGEIIEPLFPVS